MKKIFLILILFLNISCHKNDFEFDAVYHFKNKISENEFYDLMDLSETNNKSAILLGILNENYITDLTRTNEIIEKNFADKKLINSKFYPEIKEIYENQSFVENSKCIPIFRDVLVFKKNDKIVAISKICFDCEIQYTLKTDNETIEMDDERIKKLKKIID